MWRFKTCPKCGGDVFLDKDIFGWYERCLQCGYNRELAEVAVPREAKVGAREPVGAATRRRSDK